MSWSSPQHSSLEQSGSLAAAVLSFLIPGRKHRHVNILASWETEENEPPHHRFKNHPEYNPRPSPKAPYGTFAGRPIILEHSPVNGGVYLGKLRHEAVVVDDRTQPGLLHAYEEVRDLILSSVSPQGDFERNVFHTVISVVASLIRFDEPMTASLTKRIGLTPDQCVTLNLFLNEHMGASRHQVLLAAYIMEKLVQQGYIQGLVHIEQRREGFIPRECLRFLTEKKEVLVFHPYQYEREQNLTEAA